MGKSSLILISSGVEEAVFFRTLAERMELPLLVCAELADFRRAMSDHPESLVVWDLDWLLPNPVEMNTWCETVRERASADRVFGLIDDPGSAFTLAQESTFPFQQVIRRSLGSIALEILQPVLAAGLDDYPFGLDRYFPPGSFAQSILLKKSEHRKAAVEAMQAFLIKSGIKSRVAASAAQAVDELLMNAIFNAPHDESGRATRRNLSRGSRFDLHRTEYVELEVMMSESYLGMRVTDRFGKLSRDTVVRVLGADYRRQSYVPKLTQTGAGLGLRGILGQGHSLLFVCKPEVRTDAMIFFPRVRSHLEFRKAFQFATYFGRLPGTRRP